MALSLMQIGKHSGQHSMSTDWYRANALEFSKHFAEIHGPGKSEKINLGEIGEVYFPYFSFGNIDSARLFGIDELILFSFYYFNRKRYPRVLDLGANIGLHTLVMMKLGMKVRSYEPDPTHLNQLLEVITMNNYSCEHVVPKAISNRTGTMQYVRVLNNTTGSHLLGSKENVYGPTEKLCVEVDDILQVIGKSNFDLVKMDVEGHEAILLDRLTEESLSGIDVILEIGSEKNACEIFGILEQKGIPAYAQKINWQLVGKLEDLPSHHSHGSVFLSKRGDPKWK